MADRPHTKEVPANGHRLNDAAACHPVGPAFVASAAGEPMALGADDDPPGGVPDELADEHDVAEHDADTSAPTKGRRAARSSRHGTAVAMPSILVVDDDEDVCEFLSVFLVQEGYRVRTESDPTRVLDLLHQEQFHICVLDLMMPKLSGMDLLGQIRRIDDDIAVVIHTGYPSLETATGSIHHAVSDYLKKPVDTDQFRAVLQRIAKKKGLSVRREDELHRVIGRRVRELRKQHGLTLKQLARRTGLSVSLLSQLERAESASSVSSLFKVASALETRIADLLSDF